jgi:hypothetical protein
VGGLGGLSEGEQGAAGVDEQSIAEFEENLHGNLYKLWNRLSSGSYLPPPVRAVQIPKQGTTDTAGADRGVLQSREGYPQAIVDVLNVGAGVVDRLRELGENATAFNAGAGTKLLDQAGELGFADCRAAGWWWLRELLDPTVGARLPCRPMTN